MAVQVNLLILWSYLVFYCLLSRSVEQVLGLANARKATCGDQGDGSGSEEGRTFGPTVGGAIQARERFLNMQQQYAKARQDEHKMLMGTDKFPTFYPRSYQGQVQGGNLNQAVGPVGSGRPMDRPHPGPQRIVWPGA